MKNKLNILLTNDDGYNSQGLKRLYRAFCRTYNVTVISPVNEHSGRSHAFTLKKPLVVKNIPKSMEVQGYILNGTPSDCVKVGLSRLCKKKPDAVVSGINNGENTGLSVYYSATVAAAREGAFWGLPAFAFSACLSIENKELDNYAEKAVEIFEKILNLKDKFREKKNNNIFFNVNFPSCSIKQCKGIKITRQSREFIPDTYLRRKDHNGNFSFFLNNSSGSINESDIYDSSALKNHYITITPLQVDATAKKFIDVLKELQTSK